MNEMSLYTPSTLFDKASGGKIKTWNISVADKGNFSVITTIYGMLGGKLQTNKKEISKGKNIGKSNETTHFEQAVSDAKSVYNSKVDEGYSPSLTEVEKRQPIVLPMLAHPYEDRSHTVTYPCYVQPKLDGVRALIIKDGENVSIYSRKGKKFTCLDHIERIVRKMPQEKIIMDGELYTPDITFQQICSAVKKKSDLTELIHFYWYDIADTTSGFKERNQAIDSSISAPYIVKVETFIVESFEDLLIAHKKFSLDGFEGTMVRSPSQPYVFKHRSTSLLKLKDFKDEEFEIIGGKEGEGKSKGQCVFRCRTSEGKEFDVRCIGENSVREEQLRNLSSYIGKKLTVKFQDWTDDGKPKFPVGIAIRDYE